MSVIERSAGRSTFGGDPERYDWARPPYPDALYDHLVSACGLKPGTRTFEVGAGTGIATRRLIAVGAKPYVAIEPDARLAAYLENTLSPPTDQLRIEKATFEDVQLPEAAFDLGVSATAFHWLEQAPSLAKVHRALRAGGWWAMCRTERRKRTMYRSFREVSGLRRHFGARFLAGDGHLAGGHNGGRRSCARRTCDALGLSRGSAGGHGAKPGAGQTALALTKSARQITRVPNFLM